MKRYFSWALALIATGTLWAQTSYVPSTRVLYEKGNEIYLGGDVFQTSKVIDPEGNPTDLNGDQSFTRYQLEFGGRYGLTRSLQVGGGARFRHNEATFLDNAGERSTATGSGLQSILANLTYAFTPVGNLNYALEGSFRYTPYTNKEFSAGDSETKLILGDDGNEYSAGLGVTYAFPKQNFLTARAGYRRPGQDLSDEIYWQAEGAMVWKHLALLAGVDGVTTLENDPYGEDDRPIFNTGPSALYNSSNREWIAPYVGLNIALGQRWRLEVRGGQVVGGQSTDVGRFYGLQLVRRVEVGPSRFVDKKFKTYDIEAAVTKVSEKRNYVVIDKGLQDDVQKGMSFDFFEFDYVGGNVLIARGTVISTKSDSAVVKITQRFNRKKQIKEGLLGRASLR